MRRGVADERAVLVPGAGRRGHGPGHGRHGHQVHQEGQDLPYSDTAGEGTPRRLDKIRSNYKLSSANVCGGVDIHFTKKCVMQQARMRDTECSKQKQIFRRGG